jgi:hypothetical protein
VKFFPFYKSISKKIITHNGDNYTNKFYNMIIARKKIIVIFQENLISRELTTKTSVNGIFYIVVEEVEHSFDVCRGQLIVTCVVGKTEIPIH